MSNLNNKSSLMGHTSNITTKMNNIDNKGKTAGMTSGLTIGKTTGGLTSGMIIPSNDIKSNKIKEGKELHEKALGFLKTSFFQWHPDHLIAAATFENSSNAYKLAGELEQARLIMIQAGESHEAAKCYSASSIALWKAAQIAQLQKLPIEAVKCFKRAANLYSISGEIDKAADMIYKAALELQESDVDMSYLLFMEALDLLCPDDTPKESMTKVHTIVLDVIKKIFTFLLKNKKYNDALLFTKKMLLVYDSFDQISALHKTLATVTILQLHIGDIVLADETFLEHLNDSKYLSSKECELSEQLVMSFRNHDVELLEKAQHNVHLNYFEIDIQKLVRAFGLLGNSKNKTSKHEGLVTQQVDSSIYKLSSELQNVTILNEEMNDINNEENKIEDEKDNTTYVDTNQITVKEEDDDSDIDIC